MKFHFIFRSLLFDSKVIRKKLLHLSLVAFLSFSMTSSIYSQFLPTAVRTDNSVMQGLTKEVEPHGWLYFNESSNLDPDSYFYNYGAAMGLGVSDEMVKTDEWVSEGQTHFRFQQYHKSIPVKYGEYTIHAGRLQGGNCSWEIG